MEADLEIQQDEAKRDISRDLARLKADLEIQQDKANLAKQDISKQLTQLKADSRLAEFRLQEAKSKIAKALAGEPKATLVTNEKEKDNLREKKGKSIDANNNKYEPIERRYEDEVQGEAEWEDESGEESDDESLQESDDVSQEESEDEGDWEGYAKDLSAYNLTGVRLQLSRKFTNTNITEPEFDDAPFQPIKGSAENPKPSQDEVNTVTVPAGYLGRQIGIATIRMELLSLTRLSRVSNSDSESDEDYQDEIRPEEGGKDGHTGQNDNSESGHDQPGGDGRYDVSEPRGRENDVPGAFPGAEPHRNKRLPGGDGGGGGRGNSPSKRRRIPPKTLQRFACPYQAYEPFQDCLHRGPRNPKGGCDGIYRLKQHLGRRHMLSFRCQMCWRSFDTRNRQKWHRTEGSCRQKPQPEGDRFMDMTHEAGVDELCGSTTLGEEDIWWKLFRLLIPGMSALDEDAWRRARSSYYPYYIAGDLSLTIPSLNFTDFTFPEFPSNIGIQTYSQYDVNTFEPPSQSFLPGSSSPSSGQVNHNSILMSQILSVPVFETAGDPRYDTRTINPETASRNSYVYDVPTEEDPRSVWVGSSFNQSNSNDSGDGNASGSWHNNAVTPATSNQTPGDSSMASSSSRPSSISRVASTNGLQRDPESASGPPNINSTESETGNPSTGSETNVVQMLRLNIGRLKARQQRTEIENVELREANRAARADMSRADEIVEELLVRDPVDPASFDAASLRLYERLIELSTLLGTAGEKLRRAS